ncbi:MAG TPA: isopentenyl-diphosphate delta-isomerase, partial [Chryseolinea sp.]|nr:isopentenyl-diphosphate delta-isomerase [Chryseolinea sp.]
YKFIYKTSLDDNLIEHECDHVFIGTYDGDPVINNEEVEDWKFTDLPSLRTDIKENPHTYTFWFKLIINHPQLNTVIA